MDDEDDSSDEEELPKVQQSKKRPVEIEQKAPAAKKAKSVATPEKSGLKLIPFDLCSKSAVHIFSSLFKKNICSVLY